MYDKLLINLQYLREYRTMEHVGADYGVRKSAVSDAIHRVEDTPVKDGTFSLPGKKAPRGKTAEAGYLAAGVTESLVHRPEKRRKRRCSGKKRHTIKTRAVINRSDQKIIIVQQVPGRRHGFRFFRENIGCRIDPDRVLMRTAGIWGYSLFMRRAECPGGRGKGHPLGKCE